MENSHNWDSSQYSSLLEKGGYSNQKAFPRNNSTIIQAEHSIAPPNSPLPHRPLRKVILLPLLLSGFLLGLLTIFATYVWSHTVKQSGGTIWVSTSNNTILLISTIISRVPPLLVPVAMGITAYDCAREWLIHSANPHPNSPNQQPVVAIPTPEQYNIALRVLGGGDLGAVWATLRYLVGSSRRKTGIIRRPHWLNKSIIILLYLTCLAYLVGGIDLWLHEGVVSVHLTTFEKSALPTTSMSRTINYTYCDAQISQRTVNSFPCASVTQGAQSPFIVFADEGLATVTNTSSLNEIVLLPDSSISLLIPSTQLRSTNTYVATTFGTYTTCAPVSLECNLYAKSGASTPYACIRRPEFRGDMTYVPSGSSLMSNFNESGTRTVGLSNTDLGAWSQPLELGIAALLQSTGDSNDPQIIHTVHNAMAILLWCEMNILNVTYLHHPHHADRIQLLSYELTNPNDTFTISGPIYKGFGTRFIDPITVGSAISTNATHYANVYAQQLSRVALALAAGITIPSTSLVDYISKGDLRGSQVSLIPFTIFLSSFFMFIISVLCIGILAKTRAPMLKDGKGRDVHAVSLAQMRLTNTAPIIYEMFCTSPEENLRRSGYSNPASLFEGDGAENRVGVGVLMEATPDVNDSQEARFGISTLPMRDLNGLDGTVLL
ncbi:hypothetical protein CPB86DRAFT_878555 [Serendipita vermifera]|nr:hypothetical protein CPB86DRAFT_878555 [Serendipita vermifera]